MRTQTRSLPFVLAAALAAPAAASAADVSTAAVTAPTVVSSTAPAEIVFPLPPDRPRIKFLRYVATTDDLGMREKSKPKGFFAKIAALFSQGYQRQFLFANPYGVWHHGDKIYATDTGSQQLVIVDLKEGVRTVIGDSGEDNLKSPVGVAVDEAGNAYVTDSGDGSVKAYAPDGKLLWKSNGTIANARPFNRPAGITLTATGEVMVADSSNRRIVILSAKTGAFIREMCRHANKEYYALPNPGHVWTMKDGGFLVSDPLAARVHIFSSTGAATGGFGEAGDQAGYMARPRGVATDSDGNIHVVDALFNRVQVFDRG